MPPEQLTALSLVVASVIAVATVAYAYLTWQLFRETRRAREAQTEPHVVIFILDGYAGIHFLDIVVRNIGRGAAYDVRFQVLQDFNIDQKGPLSTVNIFRNGLRLLPPGLEHRFFLTGIAGMLDQLEKQTIEIVARYKNRYGDHREERFILDFRHLGGMTFIGTPPDREIARSIKKLSDNIHRVVQSGKFQVMASDPEYEKKKYDEWDQKRRKGEIWTPDAGDETGT